MLLAPGTQKISKRKHKQSTGIEMRRSALPTTNHDMSANPTLTSTTSSRSFLPFKIKQGFSRVFLVRSLIATAALLISVGMVLSISQLSRKGQLTSGTELSSLSMDRPRNPALPCQNSDYFPTHHEGSVWVALPEQAETSQLLEHLRQLSGKVGDRLDLVVMHAESAGSDQQQPIPDILKDLNDAEEWKHCILDNISPMHLWYMTQYDRIVWLDLHSVLTSSKAERLMNTLLTSFEALVQGSIELVSSRVVLRPNDCDEILVLYPDQGDYNRLRSRMRSLGSKRVLEVNTVDFISSVFGEDRIRGIE